MAKLDGKQIKASTVADATLVLSYTKEDGTRAFTGDQSMGTNKLTNLAAPIGENDAARKVDVDAIAAGLAWKDSATVGTTAALPANTYANGTLGVGATLTATSVGILTVDGVATLLNDIILVKDESTGANNGIYKVTTEGTAGVAYILTRQTESDTAADILNAAQFVEEGTDNADSGWTMTTNTPITIGTTALNFTQFTGLGQITAGDGISKTGNVLDLDLATSGGLKIVTAQLSIEPTDFAGIGLEDDGSDNLRLASQGNGIGGGAGSTLSVTANGDSVNVSASGVKAAVPQTSNKAMAASLTSSDFDQATSVTLVSTPGGDGIPMVFVNGVIAEVGQGVKTKDCFFSNDGGTTARAIAAIAAADTLHWVGSVAGFELATTDVIDVLYTAA